MSWSKKLELGYLKFFIYYTLQNWTCRCEIVGLHLSLRRGALSFILTFHLFLFPYQVFECP